MPEIMFWRRIDLPGHELARLDSLDDGWRLSGTAVFLAQQRPCRLDYVVICDSAWLTSAAQVNGIIGAQEVKLAVSVDSRRRWRLNGVEDEAVEGCADIDLGFSPSTNLLPIRRLGLEVGAEGKVSAAWLPFPSLRFELLPQIYRRERERVYHYQSGDGAFTRTLEVNAAGFITRYPGLWQAETGLA